VEAICVVQYLREYESIFETALAHESVDPGVLFDEKTTGRKSCETVPLKYIAEKSWYDAIKQKFIQDIGRKFLIFC
jgi:hypothetical protein